MSKVESLTALVWRHAPSRYSGTPLVVLLKLAGLTDAKDKCAHVRMHVLGAMCGITERRAQQVVEDLKKDRALKVQYRKGKSSIFVLNAEFFGSLPLVLKPVQQQDTEEPQQVTAESKISDAQDLSNRLKDTFDKRSLNVPADWNAAWPVEFQKLLAAGHSVETIRTVARFALGVECYKQELTELGPAVLVEKFALIAEQAELFGKKEVAA